MKKYIIGFVILLLLFVGLALYKISNWGPDVSKYMHLTQPAISEIKDQKMIEIKLQGDPNATAGKAISKLYSLFYQLKKEERNSWIAAPRARWQNTINEKKEKWTGIFGLPVSENLTDLPEQKEGPRAEIAVWKYGTVAEILHKGPYGEEEGTINKLMQYIKENGYEIAGDHEEEYLKGPGMMFGNNPKNYYTIIRYNIKKTGKMPLKSSGSK